jgi:hypothetical protein
MTMVGIKSLVPVQSRGEAVSIAQSTAMVTVRGISPGIQSSLKKLLVAFPAGAPQQLDDRVIQARVYTEACEGFEECVVAYVLRRMPFHNPRNPFPPTAQDVHERCRDISAAWKRRAAHYRFEHLCVEDGESHSTLLRWGADRLSY